jgi:DNA mismatch repair protein MutS
VRAARRHLAELETHLRPAGAQPDLFSPPAEAAVHPGQPLVEALQAISPDTLTPREALEALYRLKKLSED